MLNTTEMCSFSFAICSITKDWWWGSWYCRVHQCARQCPEYALISQRAKSWWWRYLNLAERWPSCRWSSPPLDRHLRGRGSVILTVAGGGYTLPAGTLRLDPLVVKSWSYWKIKIVEEWYILCLVTEWIWKCRRLSGPIQNRLKGRRLSLVRAVRKNDGHLSR